MLTFLISWWYVFLLISVALGIFATWRVYEDSKWFLDHLGKLDDKETLKKFLLRNLSAGIAGLVASGSFMVGFIGVVGAIAKL